MKFLEDYPVNAEVLQGSVLFLLYTDKASDDFIYDIAIYADDTALYSKCD